MFDKIVCKTALFTKLSLGLSMATTVTAVLYSTALMANSMTQPASGCPNPCASQCTGQFTRDLLQPVICCPTTKGAWAAGFMNGKTRKDSETYPGYHLLTGGGIMGLEWQVYPCPRPCIPNWQWGIAFRYDYTDLDTKDPVNDVAGFDRNFDSMRAIVYTHIELENFAYLTGTISYAFNQYNLFQAIQEPPFPPLPPLDPETTFGDYDGHQWTAQVDIGYKWLYCGFTIKPEVSLYYSHLKLDSYKQIVADPFNNQTVVFQDAQNDDALFTGFDLNIAYTNQFSRAQVIPYIHGKINYQTIDNSLQDFTARNVLGGGTAFIPSDIPPARMGYQIGAGIKVLGDHNVTVLMRYDYTMKSDEWDHAILLAIKHDW